jgi:hypothetical protein
MIEYALLIMLGFCIGGLIALLLAPTLWNRAVRLTTKRLEATIPMSLSEIEADKDLLRASYAIKLRRLEAALGKMRDKSANQLVDISKLQMQIGALNDQIAALEGRLEERSNAAHVFENTIRKRFPESETMIASAKAALADRGQEIADLQGKLRRREEALSVAQRAATLQHQEIRKLRQALEKTGTDTTGRFKRRPSQWTLDEYRSEYDRLNVELSKMREQVIMSQQREATQISVLKTELQQLGEQILTATAQSRQSLPHVRTEPETQAWPRQAAEKGPEVAKRGLPPRPAARAQPWPDDKPRAAAPASAGPASRPRQTPSAPKPGEAASERPAPPAARAQGWAEAAVSAAKATAPDDARPSHQNGQAGHDSAAAAIENDEPKSKQATREALKSLLDRGAAAVGRERLETRLASASFASASASPSPDGKDETAKADAAAGGIAPSAPGRSETGVKLDQVFREIFESRSAVQGAGAETTLGNAPAEPSAGEQPTQPMPVSAVGGAMETDAAHPADAGEKARNLLDRLRHIQDRQIG